MSFHFGPELGNGSWTIRSIGWDLNLLPPGWLPTKMQTASPNLSLAASNRVATDTQMPQAKRNLVSYTLLKHILFPASCSSSHPPITALLLPFVALRLATAQCPSLFVCPSISGRSTVSPHSLLSKGLVPSLMAPGFALPVALRFAHALFARCAHAHSYSKGALRGASP